MELHSITFPGLPEPYKAAPGGYGLGGSCVDVDSWDNAIGSGWYRSSGNAHINGRTYGYVTKHADNWIIQEAFQIDDVGMVLYKAIRAKMAGVWQPWEWENPPMALGVEYRTTERYYGKAVYCKAIHFGALPANTSKTVAHGISNKTENVRHTITSSDTSRLLSNFGVTDVLADDTKIQLNTATNLSYVGVIFTLWYTKD